MTLIYNFDNLSFQMLTISRFNHSPGFFCVKGRPYAALSFRTQGSGFFDINNTHLNSEPGDILYIPAEVDYNVTYTGGESIVAHFINCNYTIPERIIVDNSTFLNIKFKELLDRWQNYRQHNDAKASIFGILQSVADMKLKQNPDCDIKKCIAYINSNFCNPDLKIPDICRIGHMSEATLRRKFLIYYEMSPKQYLMRLRMNEALTLLIKREYSVKEISRMVGFNDEKHFSQIFKKMYSLPPSSFFNV